MASEFIAFLILTTSFFPFISKVGAYSAAPAASPSSPTRPLVPVPACVPSATIVPVPPQSSAIKAGYWPSGRNSTSPPSSINLSYFTHIYYAFVELDNTSLELVVTPSDAAMLADFTATLHAHDPPIKAMLSIGCWTKS